jgi:hypothetical protein
MLHDKFSRGFFSWHGQIYCELSSYVENGMLKYVRPNVDEECCEVNTLHRASRVAEYQTM